jgi:hypothetical protein
MQCNVANSCCTDIAAAPLICIQPTAVQPLRTHTCSCCCSSRCVCIQISCCSRRCVRIQAAAAAAVYAYRQLLQPLLTHTGSCCSRCLRIQAAVAATSPACWSVAYLKTRCGMMLCVKYSSSSWMNGIQFFSFTCLQQCSVRQQGSTG